MRAHHEMLDKQLTPTFEQVGQRYVAGRSREFVFFGDFDPRERALCCAQLVLEPHQFFFLLQQIDPLPRPFIL